MGVDTLGNEACRPSPSDFRRMAGSRTCSPSSASPWSSRTLSKASVDALLEEGGPSEDVGRAHSVHLDVPGLQGRSARRSSPHEHDNHDADDPQGQRGRGCREPGGNVRMDARSGGGALAVRHCVQCEEPEGCAKDHQQDSEPLPSLHGHQGQEAIGGTDAE